MNKKNIRKKNHPKQGHDQTDTNTHKHTSTHNRKDKVNGLKLQNHTEKGKKTATIQFFFLSLGARCFFCVCVFVRVFVCMYKFCGVIICFVCKRIKEI